MQRSWEADPSTEFSRRIGRSARALGISSSSSSCPDIWELANGDFAVIGRDVTAAYKDRLPADVALAHDERLVVLPRAMVLAAKSDIPDA